MRLWLDLFRAPKDQAPTQPTTAIRRLATARAISMAGSLASYVALMSAVYARTGSAQWVAATMLVYFGTAGLAGPFAGAIGDRFDRRRVMIFADLSGAACFLALAFFTAPVALIVLAFLASLVTAPFYPAATAAVPNLVAEEDLSWANGVIGMGRQVGFLVGPAVAGLLLAVSSAGVVFVFDAFSYLVSALLAYSIHADFSRREERIQGTSIRAGVDFIRQDRVLLAILALWAISSLGVGLILPAEVVLPHEFGAGDWGFGLIVAAWALGGMFGAWLGKSIKQGRERSAFLIGTLALPLFFYSIAAMPFFVGVLMCMLASGLGEGYAGVAEELIFQRRTPDWIRSRVVALNQTAWSASFTLPLIFAGLLLELMGVRLVYALGASICLAGLLLTARQIAWPERRAALSAAGR